MDKNQNIKKEKNINETSREISDINRDNVDFTDLFEDDRNFSFIFKKTKRIVAAVFLISNFIPSDEPLRQSFRTAGINLVNSAANIKDIRTDNTSTDGFRSDCLKVVSILEIAFFAGLVTEMNFNVLKQEIFNLLSFYNKTFSPDFSGRIKDGFFAKETDHLPANPPEERSPVNSFERYADISDSEFVPKDGGVVKDKEYISNFAGAKQITDKYTNDAVSKGQRTEKQHKLRGFSPVAVKKNKRQSIIINLLKRKKSATIKDISSVISDCSEKTVQRELNSLVDQGVLYKEGERRWTKYFLA